MCQFVSEYARESWRVRQSGEIILDLINSEHIITIIVYVNSLVSKLV